MATEEKSTASIVKLAAIALILFIPFFIWYVEKYEDADSKQFLADIIYGIWNGKPLPEYFVRDYWPEVKAKAALAPGVLTFNEFTGQTLRISIAKPKSFLATHVKLERNKQGENKFRLIADLPVSQLYFDDITLEPDIVYIYRTSTCLWAFCSKFGEASWGIHAPPATKPDQFKAIAVTPWRVSLSWSKTSLQTREFEITVWPADSSMPASRLKSSSQSLSICPLRPGADYEFEARAIGETGDSNPVKIYFTHPNPDVYAQALSLPWGGESISYLWNGKEWGFAIIDHEYTSAQYFKSLYRDFYSISFNHTNSSLQYDDKAGKMVVDKGANRLIEPRLAWNGKEYGLIWTELSPLKTGKDGGLEDAHRAIYFNRISPSGKRILSPALITGSQSEPLNVKLFWDRDHYGLFWTSRNKIYYCPVSLGGNKIAEPVVVADNVNPGAEISQGKDSFGISWTSSDNGDLYFMAFAPDSSRQKAPVKISKNYQDSDTNPSPGSVFWTGKDYGICWSQAPSFGYHSVRISLIPPSAGTSKQIVDIIDASRLQCPKVDPKSFNYSGMTAYNFPISEHPKCLWNGSEIFLLVYERYFSTNPDLVSYRFKDTGVQVGQKNYLQAISDNTWTTPYGETFISVNEIYYLIMGHNWLKVYK